MRRDTGLNRHVWQIEPARLRDALLARWPTSTAKSAAQALGVPPSSVENWLRLRATPSAATLLRMGLVLGARFLAETTCGAPFWLDAAVRAEQIARLDASIDALEAERAALRAEIDDG